MIEYPCVQVRCSSPKCGKCEKIPLSDRVLDKKGRGPIRSLIVDEVKEILGHVRRWIVTAKGEYCSPECRDVAEEKNRQ